MEKILKDYEGTAYELYRRECLTALRENERIKLEVHGLQKQLQGGYKRIKELSDENIKLRVYLADARKQLGISTDDIQQSNFEDVSY